MYGHDLTHQKDECHEIGAMLHRHRYYKPLVMPCYVQMDRNLKAAFKSITSQKSFVFFFCLNKDKDRKNKKNRPGT